jgi:hypothetical protein
MLNLQEPKIASTNTPDPEPPVTSAADTGTPPQGSPPAAHPASVIVPVEKAGASKTVAREPERAPALAASQVKAPAPGRTKPKTSTPVAQRAKPAVAFPLKKSVSTKVAPGPTLKAPAASPKPVNKAAKKARAVKAKKANAPAAASAAQAPLKRADQAKLDATRKASKEKLVRDSFTMPPQDFALIAVLKDRTLGFKRATKKSELLRAGLQVLAQLSDAKLKVALDALIPLKAGRPAKSK